MPRTKQPASFQDQLIADERILWEGAPSISFLRFVWLRARWYIVLFWILTLGYLGFASGGNRSGLMAALLFGFLMIPVSIVLAVYGLFVLYREFRRTGLAQYVVTNSRIMVRDQTGMVSAPIKSIASVIKSDDSKGIGTLQFQINNFPKFYRIKDADMVYKLIADLQSKSV